MGLQEKGEGGRKRGKKVSKQTRVIAWWFLEGKEGWERQKRGINGDRRRLDFGCGTHDAMYRFCIIRLHT